MQNARYYETLMQERAQALYDNLTAGKSVHEMMEMEDELEEQTFLPRLLAEVARGLPEARAMIDALDKTTDEPIELMWVKVYPGYENGQMGHSRLTKAEIITRLKEISFLDLGEDPAAWREWLTAFEADPPMTGYR